MIRQTLLYAVATYVLVLSAVHSEEPVSNWPRWRGPADSGSIANGNFPASLDKTNVLWQVPLPGKGCSTPIVLDKKIYLTAPKDGNDALLVFDWSGELVWQAVFGSESAGKHRNGSGSNASPTTDGDAVFVYFKSGTLAAVELNGTIRWQTNLVERFGRDTLYWDHGTSPVLTDNHVIMARMHHGESWVAAFDKKTGDIGWKVARNYTTPREGDHGYATPLVVDHFGKQSILVWGSQHLTAHDPANGKVIWSCGNFNPDEEQLWPSISTPVIVDNMAVLAFGRNDRGKPRLHGIQLTGNGDRTEKSHLWKRDDVGTFVPSPVAYNGNVYLLRDKGEMVCVDPKSGDSLWDDAFPKHRAKYYASPLIAGGKLYAPREDGVVFVASVENDKFQLLSENDLGESVIGSPVPAGDRILLRGEKHLFCFTELP